MTAMQAIYTYQKTDQTTKLISEYKFKENVTTFYSYIEDEKCKECGHVIKQHRETWYDIPFAFPPYWEEKCK